MGVSSRRFVALSALGLLASGCVGIPGSGEAGDEIGAATGALGTSECTAAPDPHDYSDACVVGTSSHPDLGAALGDASCALIRLPGTTTPYVVSNLAINRSVVIKGDGTATIVQPVGQSRLFDVRGDVTVELRDLTLKSGRGGAEPGGAIRMGESGAPQVYVHGVLFEDNRATSGGAVYVRRGDLHVADATSFVGNAATTGYGGAVATVATGEGAIQPGLVEIDCSIFQQNQSKERGGAVFTDTFALVAIDATFTENTTRGSGGAIHSRNNVVTIESSSFDSNMAGSQTLTADSYGGAIYGSAVEATISDSEFYANRARSASHGNVRGGALAFSGGDLQVDAVVFDGNQAIAQSGAAYADGGAVWISQTTGQIQGSALINNTADAAAGWAKGGGLFVRSGACAFLVVSSTLYQNTSKGYYGQGGALYTMPSGNGKFAGVQFTGSIIANNQTIGRGGGAAYATQGSYVGFRQSTIIDNLFTSSLASGRKICVGTYVSYGANAYQKTCVGVAQPPGTDLIESVLECIANAPINPTPPLVLMDEEVPDDLCAVIMTCSNGIPCAVVTPAASCP